MAGEMSAMPLVALTCRAGGRRRLISARGGPQNRSCDALLFSAHPQSKSPLNADRAQPTVGPFLPRGVSYVATRQRCLTWRADTIGRVHRQQV